MAAGLQALKDCLCASVVGSKPTPKGEKGGYCEVRREEQWEIVEKLKARGIGSDFE